MIRWKFILRFVLTFWLWFYLPAINVVRAEPPPIRISVPGTMGNAPLYLRVRITLEPNERNRWVCLYAQQIQNGSERISHCWEVQAEQEARTSWRELKRLTAGQWDVVAAVLRNDDTSTLSNRYTLHVLGMGYESPE